MATVSPISPNNVSTCPHGAPFGACPICSGMGGGSVKQKRPEPPKNEMSYAECYAVWMRMKAADRREAQNEANLQRQIETLENAKRVLNQITEKLLNVLNKIENMLPSPVNALFNTVVNNILKPVMNIIANFPNFVAGINKFIQNIQREIYIVAEKLAGVFGEIKNFIRENISKTFKRFTKKVYKILNLFGLFGEDGEENNFEEDNKAFAEIQAFKTKDIVSIKEFLLKLRNVERKPKDDSDYSEKI